jgi:ribosome-associated protein
MDIFRRSAQNPAMTSSQPSPGTVRLAPHVQVPESALRFTFVAAGGPGGQNVNKVATKAQLRVALTALAAAMGESAAARLRDAAGPARLTSEGDLLLQCDESRSQRSNRDSCVRRLCELVQQAMKRPRVRRATRPTRGSRERRMQAKQRRGSIKQARQRPGDSA